MAGVGCLLPILRGATLQIQQFARTNSDGSRKREFGSDSRLLAPTCGGSGGLGGGLCVPFPTPGDGQQESRLALIGRHLVRLLRGGVLRTDASRARLGFKAAMRSMTGVGAAISLGLMVSPFILASISSRQASW